MALHSKYSTVVERTFVNHHIVNACECMKKNGREKKPTPLKYIFINVR